MKKQTLWLAVSVIFGSLTGCGGDSGVSTVSGKASFVQGGSAVVRAPHRVRSGERLTPGDDYIISPNKAKITFTSIVFRNAKGDTLSTATLTDCVVTYDRSKSSGSSLLDCDFAVPVGEITEMAVSFKTTIQLMVSDTTIGIYSSTAATGGFSTTAPTGGAEFVDFKVTAGEEGSDRSTPIIFAAPVNVAAGATPQIFITTDMIHSLQLEVDGTGNALGPPATGTNDPVALFGGTTKGTSMLYSEATSIESYLITSGKKTLRVFTDADGKPLYIIGFTCGVDGPKGAWASPPIGATIGGWLGKDSTNTISWALPTDSTYATYSAYFTMAEQTTIGGTTTANCKVSASPPPPADGKTYASGAPTLTAPNDAPILNLLAK